MRINLVSDKKETLRTLRKIFSNRFVREEIDSTFARLPLVLKKANLYFAIPTLRQAAKEKHFDFEIT